MEQLIILLYGSVNPSNDVLVTHTIGIVFIIYFFNWLRDWLKWG